VASESRTLDRLDRQILHALQVAPRAPFARIAAVLGVSEQTVARRYQRMRGAGVVRILARSSPTHQPRSSYWTLRIGCRPGTAHTLADALARRGDTAWISIGAGGAEITLQADVPENHPGLLHHLPRASNVLTFSAHQVLHRFAGRGETDWIAPEGHHLDEAQRASLTESASTPPASPPRPVAAPASPPRPVTATASPPRLVAADLPLLEALGRDGRASWAALAAATGWTQRQAAQRVTALAAGEVIYFHLDVSDAAAGMHSVANLWFTVAPAHLADVGKRLSDHLELGFVAAVTGNANLMASARVRDAEALYRYISTKVAEVPGVDAVEIVPLLARIKQTNSLMVDGLFREPSA
jgi:DNA-binding Lrp family transcriptional regulator